MELDVILAAFILVSLDIKKKRSHMLIWHHPCTTVPGRTEQTSDLRVKVANKTRDTTSAELFEFPI